MPTERPSHLIPAKVAELEFSHYAFFSLLQVTSTPLDKKKSRSAPRSHTTSV
jgi:hypothetical protein